MTWRRTEATGLAFVVSCMLALAPRVVPAQGVDTSRAAPTAGPGTIVGIVVDTLSNPIEDVEIAVGGLDRRARSGRDGVFRLADVPEGTYDLRARRVGFAPRAQPVVVGPDGGRAIIILQPAARVLERVVTTASRLGLSGVISDTAFTPLADVEVRILGGGGKWARTDSAGAFFIPLRLGSYMVQISAEGRQPRLVSVRVPSDSGRWMAVMLREGGSSRRARIAMRELRGRLAWRPSYASFFTREELAKWGGLPLTNIVRMASMRPFDTSCLAIVDGGLDRVPFWYFDVDELESVEVYPRLRSGRRSDAAGPMGDCPTVYVWRR